MYNQRQDLSPLRSAGQPCDVEQREIDEQPEEKHRQQNLLCHRYCCWIMPPLLRNNVNILIQGKRTNNFLDNDSIRSSCHFTCHHSRNSLSPSISSIAFLWSFIGCTTNGYQRRIERRARPELRNLHKSSHVRSCVREPDDEQAEKVLADPTKLRMTGRLAQGQNRCSTKCSSSLRFASLLCSNTLDEKGN